MPVSFMQISQFTLVIGSVDNGPARRDIARKFNDVISGSPVWWIDSGNGENFGQVLIGNSTSKNINDYRTDNELFSF